MEKDLEMEARKRVAEKAKFYKHLTSYLIINGVISILSIINGHPFANAPMLFGWGIGLAFHYVKVFGLPGSGLLSREWEDQEVKKEVKRLKGEGNDKGLDLEEPLQMPELKKNYRDSDLV